MKKKSLIRDSIIRGAISSNPEIGRLLAYYLFAEKFGWTKDQTDNLDAVFAEELITLIEAISIRQDMETKK